jgi:carboxypeptidase C (cathepsin A)
MLAGGPTASGRMDGITLNGVALLGQAMNMSSAIDISVLNALPTLAATAWYHGKVDRKGKTVEQQVEDARAFAGHELVRAFYAGTTLPASERSRIADRLASLIGLPSTFILEHNLRIDPRTFSVELLKGSGRQVGLYDGRFTLPLSPSGGDPVADDPAMGQYVPSFVATFNDYVGKELEVQIGSSYDAIEFRKVNARWDYGAGPGVPAPGRNFAEDLAIAMRRNPGLKLFVGTGYYDLVATVGSAEYTIAHADIDHNAVSFRFYRSGHMPYVGVANRRAVTNDLRQFIAAR